MPRCPKGTRKNISTGKCESSKNKTLSNTRIRILIEKEKRFRKETAAIFNQSENLSETHIAQYKKSLSELHFSNDVKLNQITDISTALRKSIEHKNKFGQNM
jgi:hypothetical protein